MRGSFPWIGRRRISLATIPQRPLDARRSKSPWTQIQNMLDPQKELGLVSPYVVPHVEGANFLLDTASQGIQVSILTNSLEATDVAAVHAGYAKWRKRLLEGGVRLFELKRASSPPQTSGAGPLGSSASSLHAKTFTADRSRVFIGSFNFDPRSRGSTLKTASSSKVLRWRRPSVMRSPLKFPNEVTR